MIHSECIQENMYNFHSVLMSNSFSPAIEWKQLKIYFEWQLASNVCCNNFNGRTKQVFNEHVLRLKWIPLKIRIRIVQFLSGKRLFVLNCYAAVVVVFVVIVFILVFFGRCTCVRCAFLCSATLARFVHEIHETRIWCVQYNIVFGRVQFTIFVCARTSIVGRFDKSNSNFKILQVKLNNKYSTISSNFNKCRIFIPVPSK